MWTASFGLASGVVTEIVRNSQQQEMDIYVGDSFTSEILMVYHWPSILENSYIKPKIPKTYLSNNYLLLHNVCQKYYSILFLKFDISIKT